MNDRSREQLLGFLNSAIAQWTHERDVCASKKDPDSKFPSVESIDVIKAKCYIDAYRSMRVYLVTTTTPPPEKS
jgi:hypothetical protein